jgi:hypothetical protein
MKLMKLVQFVLPFGCSRLVRAGIRLFGHLTAVSAIVAMSSLLPQANAQPITIPQQAPYTNDAYTVLLEHFDGTTGGSANGSVTYTNGVFGQGVHLNAGSWVSWNRGALSQGTVEFWGKLDTITNTGIVWPSFVNSCFSQFYGGTFNVHIYTNTPATSYHNGSVWVATGTLNPSPVITANTWHHYATTWGGQGFHFYVDGMLVYSNANTSGQNASTGWWCIGGQSGAGPAYDGDNFTGAIDELRISNIQRTFAALPLRPLLLVASAQTWAGFQLLQLTWTNNGFPCVLESAGVLTGGWSTVSTPLTTNANLVSTVVANPGSAQFYRLRMN